MSGITLHPTKGVNAHMTICRQCGNDVGIAMLGVKDFKDICTKCGTVHYGGANKDNHGNKECSRCQHWDFKRERIEDNEKLPIEICDDCKKLNEQVKEMVRQGGIHFRCKVCGSAGAIKAGHPLSIKVREQSKIAAPEPVGIEFDDCGQHGGNKTKGSTQ